MAEESRAREKAALDTITEWVEKSSGVKILEAGVNLENLAEQFLDDNGRTRDFEEIPLDSLPRKRRFKLYLKIKEADGREITAITSTESTYESTLRHPKRLDATEFTARSDELDTGVVGDRTLNPDGSVQEAVRHEVAANVSARALQYVQVVISIINTLINAGIIGRH
jgi:hypothetical protein